MNVGDKVKVIATVEELMDAGLKEEQAVEVLGIPTDIVFAADNLVEIELGWMLHSDMVELI